MVSKTRTKFTHRIALVLFSCFLLIFTANICTLNEAPLLQELQKLQASNTETFNVQKWIKRSFNTIQQNVCNLQNWLKNTVYPQYNKQNLIRIFRLKPRFSFDDIVGLDHAKQLLGTIIRFIQDPANHALPTNKYLFYGPSRTGKSMIIDSLPAELRKHKLLSKDVPVFEVLNYSLGIKDGLNYLKNIIRTSASCIIHFDGIDALKVPEPLFQELLSIIRECDTLNDPVIILATANYPEKIDPSLLAQFKVHIPFECPSYKDRAQYLRREIEHIGLSVDQFDINKLAEVTENASFMELHQIISHAQYIAQDEGREVAQIDIEKALDNEMHRKGY